MDKKDIIRILESLKNRSAVRDQDLPAEIRQLMDNARNGGAEVLAVSMKDLQDAGISGEVMDMLHSRMGGFMLECNPFRERSNPRYALSFEIGKEVSRRDIELTTLMRTGMPSNDINRIRLMTCFYCDINMLLERGQEKFNEAGRDLPVEVKGACAVFKTLGFSNLFDVVKSGPHRAAWHGVSEEAYDVARQICMNAVRTVSGFSAGSAKIDLQDLLEPIPLAPLAPELKYVDDFNGPFYSRFPEHAILRLKMVESGYTGMADVMNKTVGIEDLASKCAFSENEMNEFGEMMRKVEGVSVEATAALSKIADESGEADSEAVKAEAAKNLPFISPDEPEVLVALGHNLTQTIKIAGVTDLHQMTGLRSTPEGTELMSALAPLQREEIVQVCRYMAHCDCDECKQFEAVFLRQHPNVANVRRKDQPLH